MQTLILECLVTAKTQISHNGGELNGNVANFRRMKVVQPDGKYTEVPHVSGNSMRGTLRDISAKYTLDLLGDGITPHKVSLPTFQLMFSGGALTQGNNADDIGKYRQMRENLTHLSLFGGAYGNAILAGKMKINPLLPIAKETAHIIPAKFHTAELKSVFTYLQLDMYTRKENSLDGEFQQYIERTEGETFSTSQMIYYMETLAAGTPFYWKIILEDVTPEEFDFFLTVIQRFKQVPVVGGKGAVGFGQVELVADTLSWRDISKEGENLEISEETTESLYAKKVTANKEALKAYLSTI